jgi:hypothetical protein
VIRDFASFLAALWSEWKVFLTGGTIVAVSEVWNLTGWKPLPHSVNWLILGLTFILAAFSAWRKEWIAAGRDFVMVRPAELVRLFNGGTKIQGSTLVKPYIGKRLTVTGTVHDVQRESGPLSYVFLMSDGVMLALRIPSWALGPFIPLPKGETITVVARIHSVYYGGIRLTNCAIVPAKDGSTQRTADAVSEKQQPVLPRAEAEEKPGAGKQTEPNAAYDKVVYLVDLFKKHTGIQAMKLVEPFIGQPVQISGSLNQVFPSGLNDRILVTFNELSSPLVLMYFEKEWTQRLSMLQRDQKLTVRGRISRVSQIDLELGECELVDRNGA